VSATPGTRALESGGQAETSTAAHEGDRIRLPSCLVEIDGQRVAGLVEQHRVDACDEWLIAGVSPRQMPSDDLVCDREETAMRAHRTLDPGLLTDAPHPLVGARGRIAGLPGLSALEPTRVNVFAAAEQRSEEGDLCRNRRVLTESAVSGGGRRRGRVETTHRLRRIGFGAVRFETPPLQIVDGIEVRIDGRKRHLVLDAQRRDPEVVLWNRLALLP
jgi:hypothetical protein